MLALLNLLTLLAALLVIIPSPRQDALFEQRLAWNQYCSRHGEHGTLVRRLRMTKESFEKLVLLIQDDLQVDEKYADLRGGAIIPELCLFCTLRYLAGGSYLDITNIVGISQSSFYRVIWKTISALVKCNALRIRFPKTKQEITAGIAGFAGISTDGAIHNCVGVVDGYLLRIRVPAKDGVKNVRSFFSGHYQCYGINIQAAADHHSRFIHFSFAAPGVTGDRDAIKQCSLYDLNENLPLGVCCIGDAAYEPTEHMVPIYQGADKLTPKYDNFNFFASQCRIRVEMAFGMMQAKWGILQRPVSCTINNMIWLSQAIARLHNYCINERLELEETAALNGELTSIIQDSVSNYIPSVPHDKDGDPVRLNLAFEGINDGYSHLREWMAARVQMKQLQRPKSSKKRKREA